MISRVIKVLSQLGTPAGLLIMVVILGMSFVAVVLVPGLELASEVADSSTALKLLGEQQRQPTIIRAALEAAHDRLGSRGYVQESLDELRASSSQLDSALREMTKPRPVSWFALTADTGAVGAPIAGKHSAMLIDTWAREQVVLNPLLEFRGVPYQDNESTGTNFNESGRQLERDVGAALRTGHHTLPLLDSEFTTIAAELQATNLRSATELRLVMLSGLVIALALVVLVTVMLGARQRQESSLRLARQQTTDILRTVKDGLFLLDHKLTIGAAYSGAMEALFQRTDFAGLAFENLLKSIVSEKTLATALKFVKILWAERTNEKLVKTINPLGEVEVHLDGGSGKFDTRYLQFEFHRVRVDGEMTHVLVSVSDVSARVELARELQSSQNQAQGQVDTLLGILHIDPAQLTSFLNDSNAAMKMINAVLREPTREEGVFRKKLDTLFRQVHSVKGEAAALGMSSIETRAHAFEDDLKSLKDKPALSGNDFLPLVIKLDDLLTHLQSVSELVSRLSKFQLFRSEAPAAPTDTQVVDESAQVTGPLETDSGLGSTLQQLADRVAAEYGKEAQVRCNGLDLVPEEYRRIVKDIAIQGVRNAVVHGIEPAAVRVAAGKSPQGMVRLDFRHVGEGFKFSVEDDGQGLATDKIKEVALQKGYLTADQAENLDPKKVLSLLFQPGFSTVETTTKDAGRGVGMNLMADLMRQIGGRVGVATAPGRYTRVTVTLPVPPKPVDDTVAA